MHDYVGAITLSDVKDSRWQDCRYIQAQQQRQTVYHQFLRHMVQALQP